MWHDLRVHYSCSSYTYLLPIMLLAQMAYGSVRDQDSKSAMSTVDSRVSPQCPAKCPSCPMEPKCPDGVKLQTDPCGCCAFCARQEGEDCRVVQDCQSGLLCSNGTCRPLHALSCKIGSKTYEHGEIWQPNCQTVCQCENGIYGCSDVCQPDKTNSECRYGRVFVVESPCCSRWTCRQPPKLCSNITLDWSNCSCANPISHQWTRQSPSCQWIMQQRVCSLPPDCPSLPDKHGQADKSDNTAAFLGAKKFCEKSLYHRYEFVTEDNCKSKRMHHQKTCASECHMPDGRKLCCLPNEFESMPVLLKCGNQKTVLRTLATIAGCNCALC